MNKRSERKETVISPLNKQKSRIFAHKKAQPSDLLDKKPQLLLMKWSHFLQKYHITKQMNTANLSLNMVFSHLKSKKHETVIHDVPYIESEQVSIHQRDTCEQIYEQKQICKTNQRLKKSNNESSKNIEGSDVLSRFQAVSTAKGDKIVFSIKLSEQQENENSMSEEKKSQNFTDDEDESSMALYAISRQTGSKHNKHENTRKLIYTEQVKKQPLFQEDSMRRTACFSSFEQSQNKVQKIQSTKNQQNINILNKNMPKQHIKSKKVDALLSLQLEQSKRRQRARQLIKQDQQYLKKLICKK